jgi:hypothetical protein
MANIMTAISHVKAIASIKTILQDGNKFLSIKFDGEVVLIIPFSTGIKMAIDIIEEYTGNCQKEVKIKKKIGRPRKN